MLPASGHRECLAPSVSTDNATALGYQALFLAAAGLMGAAALFFWSRFRRSTSPG